MESNICMLTAAALQAPNDGHSDIITRAFDLKDQYAAIRMAVACRKLDDGWTDLTTDLVNYVATVLGPLRNRYVHDVWTVDEGQLKRLDFTPKVIRPQSRQPKTLRWGTVNDHVLEDIALLTDEIKEHGFFMWQIGCDISRRPLPPLASRLAIRPPQRLRAPQT